MAAPTGIPTLKMHPAKAPQRLYQGILERIGTAKRVATAASAAAGNEDGAAAATGIEMPVAALMLTLDAGVAAVAGLTLERRIRSDVIAARTAAPMLRVMVEVPEIFWVFIVVVVMVGTFLDLPALSGWHDQLIKFRMLSDCSRRWPVLLFDCAKQLSPCHPATKGRMTKG